MLEFLHGKASERKFRLFAVACCRRIWGAITNPHSREAVEVAERHADLEVGDEGLLVAHAAAYGRAWRELPAERAAWDVTSDDAFEAAHETVGHAAWSTRRKARASELRAQVALIHDVFNNPFRQVRIEPSCLTWQGSLVREMAQTIYGERRFEDLPILADALEDAGCDNADILDHCRRPGEHARGCWVVDLLLGKT
jgi:hypothetical protein